MTRRLLGTAVSLLAAAGTAGLVGATTATAATPTPAHPPVRVIGDCQHARYQPHTVIIACGDAGIFIKNINYFTWGPAQATGDGVFWVNTDSPNAAAGHYVHSRMHFVMDKPKHIDGQLRFARVVMTFDQAKPNGTHAKQTEYLVTRPLG